MDDLPAGLRALAGRLTSASDLSEQFSAETDVLQVGRAIAIDAKHRVQLNPANSIAWADLALAHTTQGMNDRAKQELRVALSLAPENRFVLRAAARFYVHLGDPARANQILNSTSRVLSDPWLLAAELSTSQLAFGRAGRIRQAREVAASQQYSPRAVSELLSELATGELHAGRDRRARELFRASFVDPTENAVAQAASFSAKANLDIAPGLLEVERGFEARALDFARAGEWSRATTEATLWHSDQPFSLEPYHFASYTAAVGSADFSAAARISQAGLRVHPHDRMLKNNAAYALANLGRVAEARHLIASPETYTEREDFVELATIGLIHFREGDVLGGATRYERSIRGLTNLNHRNLAAMAAFHWALEEARARSAGFGRAIQQARRLAPHLPAAERDTLNARIEGFIA
ncbi:hypothetical protein ACPPVQ_03805 [Diaminobutyricibacter sp. McL0618]|uniref:hypothetical protein n=1 Tax=Leifsonia sp. McL0618 TaxID=3415677 RepID=UPI003CEFE8DB